MTKQTMSAEAALEDAQGQLADFERGLAKATERRGELDATRRTMAVAGQSRSATYSDKTRLIQAREESLRIGLEIEDLEYAVAGAKEAVAAARQFVGVEARKLKAVAALESVDKIEQAGERCAAALSEFLGAYDQLVAISADVRRAGVGRWPAHETFAVSVRNALQVGLNARRLHTEPILLGMSQRRELGPVLANWAHELRASLVRVIDGTAPPPIDYGEPPPLPLLPGEAELLRAEAASAAELDADEAPEAEEAAAAEADLEAETEVADDVLAVIEAARAKAA